MSTTTHNRFLRKPDGWTDEEGDFAYVYVTAATDTSDKARDYIAVNAATMLGIEPEYSRLRVDHIELRRLAVSMRWPGPLPTTWNVERLIREGLCESWWEFDVSMAREEIETPETIDWEAKIEAQRARRNAEQKQQAIDWRGPRWWRLRCWLSQRLLTIGNKLEPDDQTSAMWDEDGEFHIEIVRRPA